MGMLLSRAGKKASRIVLGSLFWMAGTASCGRHAPVQILGSHSFHQLITVVSADWDSPQATLRTYELTSPRGWKEAMPPIPVVLGRAGYGWGNGLHGNGAPKGVSGLEGAVKREGDGRAPAGVFGFGRSFGYVSGNRHLLITERLRCVDDPASKYYNDIVDELPSNKDWASAETMRREDDLYEWLLEVQHNQSPVTPGHGSCIFLHVWKSSEHPTSGCTAMSKENIEALLGWLQPGSAALVALPAQAYERLQEAWELPPL